MTVFRYIGQTIVPPFMALLLMVGLISSVMQLTRLGEVAFGALGDFWALLRLSAYVAPIFAGVTLPVALLLACLIAYDRLSDSGELFAFATAGISSRRLFAPCVAFTLPVALASMLCGLYAVPWGIGSFLDEMAELTTRSFSQALKPHTFSEVLGTTALYAAEIDTKRAAWRGVFLAHAPADVDRELLIFAPEISVIPKAEERLAVLRISRGETLLLGAGEQVVERTVFESGEGMLDLKKWAQRETGIYYDYQSHQLLELLDDIAEQTKRRKRRKIEFFMWQKLTLPFGCFPLALMGALLGTGRSAERRARAYVWGVMIGVLFFISHEGARGLCADGTLPPLLAASTSVLWSSLAAVVFWYRRSGLRQ